MDQKQQHFLKQILKTPFFSQSQNIPQTTSNSVIFLDQPRSSQEQSGNYPFFQKRKTIHLNTIPENNLIIMHKIFSHQMMKNTIIKIISDFIQAKDLILTVLTNQIFWNHTHETNKYDNLEITQHLTTVFFKQQNPVNTQSYQPTQMHNEILLPYYLQQHEITKSQPRKFS